MVPNFITSCSTWTPYRRKGCLQPAWVLGIAVRGRGGIGVRYPPSRQARGAAACAEPVTPGGFWQPLVEGPGGARSAGVGNHTLKVYNPWTPLSRDKRWKKELSAPERPGSSRTWQSALLNKVSRPGAPTALPKEGQVPVVKEGQVPRADMGRNSAPLNRSATTASRGEARGNWNYVPLRGRDPAVLGSWRC